MAKDGGRFWMRPGRGSGSSFGARVESSVLYSMWLAKETRLCAWAMRVDRALLVEAVAGFCGVKGRRGAKVVLTVCERGLSLRSGGTARDLPAKGFWASPIAVGGTALRRAAAGLADATVDLEYGDGLLWLNGRSLGAREL